MTTEGYSSVLGVDPGISVDEKFQLLGQSLLNLKKVCSSIIDLYSTMHNALLGQLQSQLNFNVKAYAESQENIMKDLMLKRERLEDEIYGVTKVEDTIKNGDIVKLIVDRDDAGRVTTNRTMGGVYYIIGRGQLIAVLEDQIRGRKIGDKLEAEVNENGKIIKYTMEVVGVKRRKGNDEQNDQPK